MDTTLDAVSNILHYHLAQSEVRRWTAEHEAASAHLELALVRQRAAEVACQHEPLATIEASPAATRDKMLAAVRYVVVGRTE